MPKGIPNKKYTGEFKQMVVETIQKEKLSYKEAMRRFKTGDHGIIQRWERIYLEEGIEGLYIERRGRSNLSCKKNLDKQVADDLISEVQRLRAENAYLKNLQALVMERERQQRKKRW